MPKVVFDSSFLIAVVVKPTTWHEDMRELLGKVEPVALDCVVAELERIAARGTRKSRFASLALGLAEGFTAAKCGEAGVDDEVASYARTHGSAVATVDGDLIASLKTLGIRVVTLKRGRVALA